MYDNNLKDKVVLITGATGLLGSQYAECLAQNNANLILCDIDEKKVITKADYLQEKYQIKAIGLSCDVRNKSSIEDSVESGVEHFGKLTSVINNAAATGEFLLKRGEVFTNLADFDLDVWDETIKTNLSGPFLVAQAVEKHLKKNKGGSVINISSTYGVVGPDHRIYEGLDFNSAVAYAASKAGIHGLTRWLSTYWGKYDIRVNSMVPGGVYNNHDPIFVERYSERTPLGRMADKEDMPGMILYLVSDMSKYCTGQQYFVDGGWTAI